MPQRHGTKQVWGQSLFSTVNTGVPAEQTAFTWVCPPAAMSPRWKVTSTSSVSDLSTSTRQPLSGWAIRSVMPAPLV